MGMGTRIVEGGSMDVVADMIYVALIVAFFGATLGLIHFCAGLMGKGGKP
jgi:hypothetical protein